MTKPTLTWFDLPFEIHERIFQYLFANTYLMTSDIRPFFDLWIELPPKARRGRYLSMKDERDHEPAIDILKDITLCSKQFCNRREVVKVMLRSATLITNPFRPVKPMKIRDYMGMIIRGTSQP